MDDFFQMKSNHLDKPWEQQFFVLHFLADKGFLLFSQLAKYGQEARITKNVFYAFENDKKALQRATAPGKTITDALQ